MLLIIRIACSLRLRLEKAKDTVSFLSSKSDDAERKFIEAKRLSASAKRQIHVAVANVHEVASKQAADLEKRTKAAERSTSF